MVPKAKQQQSWKNMRKEVEGSLGLQWDGCWWLDGREGVGGVLLLGSMFGWPGRWCWRPLMRAKSPGNVCDFVGGGKGEGQRARQCWSVDGKVHGWVAGWVDGWVWQHPRSKHFSLLAGRLLPFLPSAVVRLSGGPFPFPCRFRLCHCAQLDA